MPETMRLEIEIDEGHHCDLCREAERLGLTTEEVARRAIAAWLIDAAEDVTNATGAALGDA